MNKFDSDEERIFNRQVTVTNFNHPYIEYGPGFVRFIDLITGKMFQVEVTEVIERKQKPKIEKEKPQKKAVKGTMTIEEFRKLKINKNN
jgi:hypothetical protein